MSVRSFEPVDFVVITDASIDLFDLTMFNNTNKVLMAVDEKLLEIPDDDFNEKSISEAINWELNADVEHLSVDTYYRIFMSPMINKLFLIKQDETSCPELTKAFEEAAVQNRHQDLYSHRVLFVVADISQIESSKYPALNQILWQMAGEEFLKSRECTVLLSGMRLAENTKYLLEKGQTKEDILDLIERHHALKLSERFYKSEMQGETYVEGTSIFRVIGSNFKDQVISKDTHDFLLVCRENNIECAAFVEFLELIAQKIDDFDLRFGVLDSKRNEVPALKLGTVPAFLFYRKDKKLTPEVLMKKFDYGSVLEFINQWLNKVDKKQVNLDRADKAALLANLSDKFPEDFAAIKQSFDEGVDFTHEYDSDL